MHIAAVATGFNTHRRTVQIACYAANITGDIFFIIITIVITAGDFISKAAAILFDTACSHNIAAVVNNVQNAVILFLCIFYICCTKITGNTAYVHRTADIAFYVIGIGDIAVFSTADNTADVACCIMVEAIRMIIASYSLLYQRRAYIRFVGYIPQFTTSTAANNAADVGCTYLSLMSAGKHTVIILPIIFLVICMINIAVSSIAIGLDNAFVRGIINSCIGNTANDTANIIATLNSIIVNQRILRATNSRIFCSTNHAADIVRAIIYTGNFTKVIGALVLDTVFLIIGQLAALHIANQAANIANTADITGISQVRQLTAAAVRLNGTGSISKAIGTPCIILSITDDTANIVFTADLQRTVDALDRGINRMTDKGTGISIAALHGYASSTGNQRYIAHNSAVSKTKQACGLAIAVITVLNAQAKDRIVKAIKLALEGIFPRIANRSLVTARQVNRITQGIMVPHAPTFFRFADFFQFLAVLNPTVGKKFRNCLVRCIRIANISRSMPAGACCCIHRAALIADIGEHHIFAPFSGLFRRAAAKYNIILAVITNTIVIIRLADNSQGISLSGGIKTTEAIHINNYTFTLKDQLIGVDITQAHKLGVGHFPVLLQRVGDISIFGPGGDIIYLFVGNMQAADINFRTVANLHAVGVNKIDIAALLITDIGIQLAVNLRAFAAGNIVQHIKVIVVTTDSYGSIGTDRKAVPGDNGILRRLVQIHLVALRPVAVKTTFNLTGNYVTLFPITGKHVVGNNAVACGTGNPWH